MVRTLIPHETPIVNCEDRPLFHVNGEDPYSPPQSRVAPELIHALPIANRRYSRLKICATPESIHLLNAVKALETARQIVGKGEGCTVGHIVRSQLRPARV